MNPVQGYFPPNPLGLGFPFHFLRGLVWRVFMHFDVFQKVPKSF